MYDKKVNLQFSFELSFIFHSYSTDYKRNTSFFIITLDNLLCIKFEDIFFLSIRCGLVQGFDGNDIPIELWNFSGALLYSITVITTIGEDSIPLFARFWSLFGLSCGFGQFSDNF